MYTHFLYYYSTTFEYKTNFTVKHGLNMVYNLDLTTLVVQFFNPLFLQSIKFTTNWNISQGNFTTRIKLKRKECINKIK